MTNSTKLDDNTLIPLIPNFASILAEGKKLSESNPTAAGIEIQITNNEATIVGTYFWENNKMRLEGIKGNVQRIFGTYFHYDYWEGTIEA